MKRNLLCIILAASLCLSVVIPATALVKGGGFEDFEATGAIVGLAEYPEMKLAGMSDRWIVAERSVRNTATYV